MGILGQKDCTAGTRTALCAAVLGLLALCSTPGMAQDATAAPVADSGPGEPTKGMLPDTTALLQAVEVNQRTSEAVRKDYLYHSVQTFNERDKRGGIKKTEVREYDDFWINGTPVQKLVKKDGKDLSPDEQKKESERIDKEAAKARERRDKADANGKESDPRGNEEITVSRFLELGSFTNARLVTLNGRDTIAMDFAGNLKAKTRNRGEEVIRDLVGTIWVDEKDRQLARIEGHFLNSFKVGAGLVMDIQKDTSFSLQMKKINGEVWLPAQVNGKGAARVLLLVNFNGEFSGVFSDYRKFRATSTILPMMSAQENAAPSEPPAGFFRRNSIAASLNFTRFNGEKG